jgi:hypothetical protein
MTRTPCPSGGGGYGSRAFVYTAVNADGWKGEEGEIRNNENKKESKGMEEWRE